MKKLTPFASIIRNTAAYVIFVGLLFIFLAVVTAWFPNIITLFFVSIFIVLGVITILVGLRILSFYSKVNKILKKFKLD